MKMERFPGPQPISIERRHFPILRSKEYVVCEKTDGVRHLLVSCTHEGKRSVFFMNRALERTDVKIALPSDTVLDGELLGSEYYVYDAIQIKGEDVAELTLPERLDKARKICQGILKTPGAPKLKVKTMIPLKDIDQIQLGEHTDGLIFTPVKDPVRTGTHETMFKWKPKQLNTIDFKVQIEGYASRTPIYGLFLQGGECVCPLISSNAGGDPKQYLGKIVECEYTSSGWRVLKVRTDKTHANNRRTYERTLVNIREDIQRDEFSNLV